MPARFRIRTSQGQEVSFATHEMFAEFVRSGELSPNDVVYDAATREWSSALTHPVVLQIEAEQAERPTSEGSTDRPKAGDEEGSTKGPAGATGSGIGLELTPELDQLSPEEQVAAFVKRMEAERASERAFDEGPSIRGLKREEGGPLWVEDIASTPTRRVSAAEPSPAVERSGKKESRAQSSRPKTTRARRRKRASGRSAALLAIGVGVVGAGVYFGPGLIAQASDDATDVGADSIALPPPPEPLIPDTEEALRERAQERFLTTTRALLGDLPAIPGGWLHGAYLAAPSDYPEVRAAWEEILATIREVRAGDSERYRAGYLRALEDARVDGSARTLRLAAAVAEFQEEGGPRLAHYDHVEALALAALRGHDTLAEAEGVIAYEPAATTPTSGDPIIEAVGRNPEAQELLEGVLDMILAELDEPEGPGTAENVREWIWDGILDAVAS